jgi:hypothetical protein
MKADENEKWELPEALRISNPDVLKRADAMAAELAIRTNSPFGRLSPQEQERANAAIMAKDLRSNLTNVNRQITEIILVDGSEQTKRLNELQDARLQICARLSEAYASLGRFDLAAEMAPDLDVRKEYVEILAAINRDDGEWCECAPGRDHVLRDVFSLKHGRMVSIRRCTGCKGLNAGPLPVHLAEQRAHRAKAAGMVAGKTPEEAKAILSAQGHTTERLIPR